MPDVTPLTYSAASLEIVNRTPVLLSDRDMLAKVSESRVMVVKLMSRLDYSMRTPPGTPPEEQLRSDIGTRRFLEKLPRSLAAASSSTKTFPFGIQTFYISKAAAVVECPEL